MKYMTNYKVATSWLGNSLILCNEIVNIDESIYENCRFDIFEDESKEIYQWFLTDCSLEQVEYLEEHFGLLFTYSEKLDLFVLCVDHWGTCWDYVSCETDLDGAQRELGQSK